LRTGTLLWCCGAGVGVAVDRGGDVDGRKRERGRETETKEQARLRMEEVWDLGRETGYLIRMIRSSVVDSGEWIALSQEVAELVRLLEGGRGETGGEVE
jgi:hypothetical protein